MHCKSEIQSDFFQCKLAGAHLQHDVLIDWVTGQKNWAKAIPKLLVSMIHSSGGMNTGHFNHQSIEEHLTNGLLELAVHTGK